MIEARTVSETRADQIRRRAYLTGLGLGLPVVAATTVARGGLASADGMAYAALAVFLVAITAGLACRWLSVRRAERAVLVAMSVFFLANVVRTIVMQPDLTAMRLELGEGGYLNLVLLAVFAYLALEARSAVVLSVAIYTVLVVAVGWRVAIEVGAGTPVTQVLGLVRPTVAVGALMALVYGLAHLKKQLAASDTRAEAYARLAHADPLTGLANRRDLTRALDRALAQADGLAVVLLDLDRFKAINDTHGHDVGDAVLVEVARRLGDTVRHGDRLGRWGGEEFLIVCPATDRVEARAVAERCRRAVADTPVATVGDVTASFGVAVADAGDTARSVLARADQALYAAKDAGRNQVVLTA